MANISTPLKTFGWPLMASSISHNPTFGTWAKHIRQIWSCCYLCIFSFLSSLWFESVLHLHLHYSSSSSWLTADPCYWLGGWELCIMARICTTHSGSKWCHTQNRALQCCTGHNSLDLLGSSSDCQPTGRHLFSTLTADRLGLCLQVSPI